MGTRMGVVKSPNVQRLRIQVPKRDQFPGEGAAMESTTLLSKLRDAVRSRSRIDAGFCFGHVPLPLGEGGAKRRVRAGNAPSSGPSGHLLPEGEGHEPPFRLIWTLVLQEGKGRALGCTLELPQNVKCWDVPCTISNALVQQPNHALTKYQTVVLLFARRPASSLAPAQVVVLKRDGPEPLAGNFEHRVEDRRRDLRNRFLARTRDPSVRLQERDVDLLRILVHAV